MSKKTMLDKYITSIVNRSGLIALLPASIVVVILLFPIISSPGIIFFGDQMYYGLLNPNFDPTGDFFAWRGSQPNSPPTNFFQYTLLLTALELALGPELAIKSFILLLSLLPLVTIFVGTNILFSRWNIVSNSNLRSLASALVASIMTLSFVNSGITDGGLTTSWPFLMLPLTFGLFVSYVDTGRRSLLFLTALSYPLGLSQPIWIHLTGILFIAYYLYKVRSGLTRASIRMGLAILAVFTVSSFAIIPAYVGYSTDAGGIYSSYSKESSLSFEQLQYLSVFSFLDAFMLGHGEHFLFYLFPKLWNLSNIILPVLAFSSILLVRNNKIIPVLAITALLAIFLVKGVNEPLGMGYFEISQLLPYALGIIMRNPSKFIILELFLYALLITVTVVTLGLRFRNNRIRKWQVSGYVLSAVLVFAIFIPLIYGTSARLNAYTYSAFAPVEIPEVYAETNAFLRDQKGDFRVLWTPSGGTYFWKNNAIVTGFPQPMSAKEAFPEELIPKDIIDIGKYATLHNIKYVIYHSDSYPDDNSILDKIQDSRQFMLKETKNFKGIFNGNATLKLDLSLPYELLESGRSLPFTPSFSMQIDGYDINKQTAKQSIAKSFTVFPKIQEHSNNFQGTVYFEIPVRGNKISYNLYAQYFGSSFQPLLQPFFIGSLKINQEEIEFIPNESVRELFLGTVAEGRSILLNSQMKIFENQNNVSMFYYLTDNGSLTPIEYEKVSPVEYKAKLVSKQSTLVTFANPYNKNWIAYIGNKAIEPIDLDGVNGYRVEGEGQQLTIKYIPQDVQNIAYIISLLSVGILGYFSVSDIRILRKPKSQVVKRFE